MTLYEKNLKELEIYREDLFECLQNKDSGCSMNRLDDISLLNTKDGDSTIIISYLDHKYRVNSSYSPRIEAKIWADQFDFRNLDIVVILFGLGNGTIARELISRLKGNDILLIYEPSSEIFNFTLEHIDITDILSSNKVCMMVEGMNDHELKYLLSMYVSSININSQIICFHPQYDKVFTGSKEIFIKAIYDNNNYITVNQNTKAALSKIITNNTLNNLKYLNTCNIVTDLIGKIPTDIPAIIVAAGPSLDKNIDELKAAKGKAVIFAVDTAMKYLLAHGIEPDFIVTLDPQKSLVHLSDARCSQIPIFSRVEARPENLVKNNKRVILYNIEGYSKRLLNKIGKETGNLNSGGSVATGAFSICKTLGFEKIILVGLDLAYSGEKTHAGGLQVDVAGAGRFLETIEDVYGNKIKTRYDWYIYLKWFENAIQLLNDSEVIDATEGGAKIKGTTILPLKEAIRNYSSDEKVIDCDKIIQELQPTVKAEELTEIIRIMNQDIEYLTQIKDKAEEGKEICDRLINKYKKSIQETSASIAKNERLSYINNFIEKKEVYELIDWDIAADTFDYISDINVYSNDEAENKNFTYKKSKDLYNAISNSIDRVIPMLQGLINTFSN